MSGLKPFHNAEVQSNDAELDKVLAAIKSARLTKLNGSVSYHFSQGVIRKVEVKDIKDINDLK